MVFVRGRENRAEGLEMEMTPALSSNYLKVHVNGSYPVNNCLDVLISAETGATLAGEPILACSANGAYPHLLGASLR